MKNESQWQVILNFTIAYLAIGSTLAVTNKNYEFLYYTAGMSALIFIILLYHKRLHLQNTIIAGLAFVGAMHVFGGNIHLWGTRLYDIWIIQGLLKYDNLVHFAGIFVATLVAYNLLYPHLDKKLKHSPVLLALLIILVASGLGALNEILEFGAVLYLNAAQQVGDYFNNAVDLIFNLLGSIAACAVTVTYHIRRHK